MKRVLVAFSLLIFSSAPAISSADDVGSHWSSIVGDEPKPSEFYQFTCTVTVDGHLVAEQNFSTKAGLGVLSSWFSRSLAGDDNLEISLGVDRLGRPLGTYFIYSRDGHLTPTILPAGAAMPVEAQTRISGQTVHTSCQRVN